MRFCKFLLPFVLIVFLDQLTKVWIQSILTLGESKPVIHNVLHWTYHLNSGAAFGWAQNQTSLLTMVSAFVVVIVPIIWFRSDLARKDDAWYRTSLILISAGAAGNLIDRLRLGAVIDFIDVRIWPIFNIADSSISIGVFLLMFSYFLRRKNL